MCLAGKSFVVTGVLPSLDRDAAKDFIKQWGGTVKTAVSGKTQYLVAGDLLEDGRPVTASSKYRKAVEKKVKIIGQAELLEMVAFTYDPAAIAAAAAAASSSSSSSSSSNTGVSRRTRVAVRPGQSVVGLCPMDGRLGAASEYTIQHYHTLVPKPPLLLHEDAASIVGPGLCAFTALHYQM